MILGAVLVTIGAAFLARPDVRPGDRSSAAVPARSRAADEQRLEELLRANAILASDPELAAAYDEVSVAYFDGHLPAIPVRWEERLEEIGPLIAEGFRLEGATNGRLILMNPALKRDKVAFNRAFAHEAVHVALRDQDAAHGPLFQDRLRQLAEAGAFTGIVASDEEKRELRRVIDIRAGELERETGDLARERAVLDAEGAAIEAQVNDLNARTAAANQRQAGWPPPEEREAADLRRRTLQDRITDFTWHVTVHNHSVAALNQQADQYNLMVSYPDGLDRERVPRRAALPGGR